MTRLLRLIVLVPFAGCPSTASLLDQDGDGFEGGPQDCDDNNPDVYRGAPEICGNGIDDDCDGVPDRDEVGEGGLVFYEDQDRDGYGNPVRTISACEVPPLGYVADSGDCDDTNPNLHPDQADETCDGISDDCDEEIDEDAVEVNHYNDQDGDGFGTGAPMLTCDPPAGWVQADGDCDDADPDRHPDAIEQCNGIDDNCTAGADEGLLGEGPECAATDCQAVFDAYGGAGEGRFWLTGNGDPFEAECDVDGVYGGGWMKVDLEIMKKEGWVTFSNTAGARAEWDRGGGDFIVIDPGMINSCDVAPRYARAELTLPVRFGEIRGNWTFEPFTTSELPHTGRDNVSSPFGVPPKCKDGLYRTSVLFGNNRTQLLWGGDNDRWSSTSSGDPSPDWTYTLNLRGARLVELPETDEMWWEIGGNQRAEFSGAELTAVTLFVR